MLRGWRWTVVIGGLALLVALPAAIAARPVRSSPLSAPALLQMVKNSGSVAYSGYAESTGGLALPVTSQFTSLADLFGGHTQLRVWWRANRDWRVDTISLTGETDVHQDGVDVWTWDYESNRATLTLEPTGRPVRLPTSADLLPTTLARRLLSEATPAEVTRLPVRRIAGLAAPGLRLRPREASSTVDEVDVWVDPHSGSAVRVDVRGAGVTVVSTRFLDFSAARPSSSATRFTVPAGAPLRTTSDPDLIALIDRIGVARLPDSLVGISRNPRLASVGSVGVYGRGVSEFAATPLFGRTARSLRRQLSTTPGVTTTGTGQALSIGPLTLVLTPELPISTDPDGDPGTSWLLTGTLSQDKLVAAAAELTASGR